MFFLPFLGSSICDSLVVYLYTTLSKVKDDLGSDDGEQDLPLRYQFTRILMVLAVIRLFLLFGPLTYYSVTGRRLKWSAAYYTLYISSILFILVHMWAILKLDRQSLNSFLRPLYRALSNEDSDESIGFHRRLVGLSYIHRVWAILTFSLWSSTLHFVLVWHVRSTGPESVVMDKTKRDARKNRRMLAYASMNKYARHFNRKRQNGMKMKYSESAMDSNQLLLQQDSNDETMASCDVDDFYIVSDDEEDDGSSILLPYEEEVNTCTLKSYGDVNIEDGLHVVKKKRKMRAVRKFNNFNHSDSDDDFFSELQSRMKNARVVWIAKLNELQKHMLQNSSNSPKTMIASTNNFFLNFQLSPFRVLLQLFAYEEVLSNGRLDACFELDGGLGLTFYVPQLLSFLLHGAYLNAFELEMWILEKCRLNIQFAHRCFWFLRAWCLGSGSHRNMEKSDSAPQLNDNDEDMLSSKLSTLNGLSPKRIYGSETNLYKLPITFSSSSAYYKDNETDLGTGTNSKENSLSINPSSNSPPLKDKNTGSKFPIEEHRMIEALLIRVIQCGEISASNLQFGDVNDTMESEKKIDINESTADHNPHINVQNAVGTFLASSTKNGFIPVDPTNGFPSVRHLDSYTAKQRYGFMPITNGTPNWEQKNHFFGTPRFLDALLAIADDLMLVPREKRTKELRKRLQKLEVELLPSNVIYMPLKNSFHRVWRIVSEESIALSTKERVPCIICLEVVDYESPGFSKKKFEAGKNSREATNKKEIDILNNWYKTDRRPQRHNSLLDKVTQYTKNRIREFRNEIEYSSSNVIHDISEVTNPLLDKDNNFQPTDINQISSGLNESKDFLSEENHPKRKDHIVKVVKPTSSLPPLPHSNARPRRSSPIRARANSYGSSVASSAGNSRSSSPLKNIGQWISPPQSEHSTIRRSANIASKESIPPIMTGNVSKRPRRQKRDKLESGDAISIRSEDNLSPFSKTSLDASLDIGHLSSTKNALADEVKSHSTNSIYQDLESQEIKERKRKPPVVFKEDWSEKEARLRSRSAYGGHPGWRLLPILIKSNDDLRQEQLASQLIQRMSVILARGKIPVWLCPYEIIALNDRGGIIEAIPDTISIDSLKRNYPDFTTLKNFFTDHFGVVGREVYNGARANFVESLAAYSIVCYIMQIKDRHNGNILLDSKGHIVHIDFGFFFLSSPGKNSGFESAPFKLTSDFVALMDGPFSRTFARFRTLCYRTFLELRKHCYEITLLVEMLTEGNEDLSCFRERPEDAVRELRQRFRLDLSDRACSDYVNSLIDESLENWRTTWYDRYQRYCVGVL